MFLDIEHGNMSSSSEKREQVVRSENKIRRKKLGNVFSKQSTTAY
jgi:hypothetical protein